MLHPSPHDTSTALSSVPRLFRAHASHETLPEIRPRLKRCCSQKKRPSCDANFTVRSDGRTGRTTARVSHASVERNAATAASPDMLRSSASASAERHHRPPCRCCVRSSSSSSNGNGGTVLPPSVCSRNEHTRGRLWSNSIVVLLMELMVSVNGPHALEMLVNACKR
jgi:hypothetical protein